MAHVSYQRIYFYLNVQRTARWDGGFDSPEPEDKEMIGVTDEKVSWEETQHKLIAEGKRPPFDPRYASPHLANV